MDTSNSSTSTSTTKDQTVVNSSDGSQPTLIVATRPKRGRKPKIPTEQSGKITAQIQEIAIQDTTIQETQETITTVIERLPSVVDATMASTSSTQQIPQITRPKRGRKPKNSSPEQPVGTESEILQIQETATTNQDTTTQETTTTIIEQLPPDVAMANTSSTQQIPQITRPKRGRKPKNPSPKQPVETESEILQIQETVTQETTTTVIEQPPLDVAIASTSSTQQIPQITRPKRGRKPKNSSPEQPVETESEILQIQETATQDTTNQDTTNQDTTTRETTTTIIEQPLPDAAIASTSSTQQISQIPPPKRGRKPKNSLLEQPVGTEPETLEQVATTSQRGRKRKTIAENSTTANQVASNNPDEEVSEGNPPKRGRINVPEQESEPVEVPSTTTEATKIRGKKRKLTTENDNEEQVASPAKENKKSRAKKPEEKRIFRTRTICSAPIYERIIRAEQQRIYMVSRKKVNDLCEEFAILGSTGNIYTVTIEHVPRCTCPDFNKGHLCKHIFFVYLKVFRLNRDSSIIFQRALLSKELRSIFANAAPDPTVLANQKVRDKYNTFTSGKIESDTDENEKRRPIEGNCPICYELLEEKDHKNIVWCKEGCGNNLHKDCFEQWKRSKRGDKVTCVYCRINWVDPDSKISINEEGYVNLGDVQGMNTIRDTTTYYRNYRSWF